MSRKKYNTTIIGKVKNTRYDMTQSQSSLIYVYRHTIYTHMYGFPSCFSEWNARLFPFFLSSLSLLKIQSNKKFSFNIIMHILWLNIEYRTYTHTHTHTWAWQNKINFLHTYIFILIHFMFVHTNDVPRDDDDDSGTLWHSRTTRICWCCCCCCT